MCLEYWVECRMRLDEQDGTKNYVLGHLNLVIGNGELLSFNINGGFINAR